MVLLLLGLALSLAWAQEFNPWAVVQRNYNLARISGDWHSVSMASDNLTRIREDGDLRIFIRKIKFLTNGSLKFDFHFMVQGQCENVVIVCEKTQKNGEFSITYEGDNKVQLTETDYNLYITFYMQNFRNGTQTQVLALYGRIPKLSASFLKRFAKTCRKYGLSSQNIINMENQDHCYDSL